MGQQQLLLIVLSAIIVLFAIVIGLTLFVKSASEADRDQMISDLIYLSSDAQAFYKKRDEYGGGDGSFKGWTIPEFYKKHENKKNYIKVNVKKSQVTLNGYGTELGINGKSTVQAKAIVTPTNTSITILN